MVVVPSAPSLGFLVEGFRTLLERIWRGCATVLAAMLTTFVVTVALDLLRRRAKARGLPDRGTGTRHTLRTAQRDLRTTRKTRGPKIGASA